MIHEVCNIELCELLETEPKAQCKVCLSYWNIGLFYCTCGHFLHKQRGANQQFINYTMDLLSVPEYAIKKGRLHKHRYGKKPGDKEYYTADQLKKKCKKKFFQCIHDRFIRDEQFRKRMIENHRDEDACRQMECSHSPFDSTRIPSQKGLHSNKQGSNTMSLRHRLDFKQALSTLQRLQQEAGEEPQVPSFSFKNQQWEARSSSSTWWNWQGSRWTPYSESQDGDAPSIE